VSLRSRANRSASVGWSLAELSRQIVRHWFAGTSAGEPGFVSLLEEEPADRVVREAVVRIVGEEFAVEEQAAVCSAEYFGQLGAFACLLDR
jgi:hypothetical protein